METLIFFYSELYWIEIRQLRRGRREGGGAGEAEGVFCTG